MLINVGILQSQIKTEDKKLLSQLVTLYSEKQPGYNYTPGYRRGGWDGTKKFVSATGKFRTGLLSSILKDLAKVELYPEIKFTYDPIKIPSWEPIDKFTLFPFQEKAIQDSLDKTRAIIQSPTGSGKSLIMANLVKALEGRKGVILFNSIQLITQFYKFLEFCGIKSGICFGNNYLYNDIMLCTVQSIDKILDTHLEEAEFLMVDEVHEFSKGKVSLEAIQSFPNAPFRFGFTATVPTENIYRLNLEGALGEVIVTDTTKNMVEQGFLVKPVIQTIPVPTELEDHDYTLTYLEIYNKFIVDNPVRNKMIAGIVNKISSDNSNARVLILVESLKHIENLKELISGPCFTLQGKDDITTRYETIKDFLLRKETTILIGSNILQTGVNIEEITHLILARGMKSEIGVIQALGRALRKHESKEQVFIYDFIDSAPFLDTHSKRRLRHYKKEGHEVSKL